MKIKKITAVFLILFLFAGFTPVSVYAAKKPITSEQTMYDYVNLDWWKNIDDEYLTEYIIKAVQYNNDLKIATLKVEEKTESKNITRANEMPGIGVSAVPAMYKLPTLTNTDGIFSLPIYANYEVDLFGKNRDKTQSMDKTIEITRQNERSAYLSVVSAVGSAYYNVVKLDKLIEIQENIVTDRKKIYDLMQLSNQEGLVSTADTVSAYKAYIKANSDIIELQKARERALNMLAVLTGDSPENSSEYKRIAFDDISVNKEIPVSIASEVITSRPDYVAAERNIEKAGLDVRSAKKEFLPSINLLGLLSFNSSDLLKMNWKNSFSMLAANGMLPIFTGARVANLKLNKNKYKQAIESYEKTNLTAIQEINDALFDLKSDNEKYNKTLESYEAEQKDFYYTNLKFKEGIISNLDLLQKKEALLVTQKLAVNDKIAIITDHISLYKATAGNLK